MIGIYKITNLINKKVYIGQSINIEYRWEKEKGGKINSHLKSAFKKYGKENFSFEILEETENLNEREVYWINYYKSYDKQYGYNKTFGGDSFKQTDEMIQKRIKTLKETTSKKVLCIETNAIYESLIDAKRETGVNNIGSVIYGFQQTAGGYHWKYLGEVIKKKNNIGNKKPVICIETGEEFLSKKEAADYFNIPLSNINNVLIGRVISTNGLTFRYLNKETNLKVKNLKKRKIICIETNKIYESIAQLEKEKKVDHRKICYYLKINKEIDGLHYKYMEI